MFAAASDCFEQKRHDIKRCDKKKAKGRQLEHVFGAKIKEGNNDQANTNAYRRMLLQKDDQILQMFFKHISASVQRKTNNRLCPFLIAIKLTPSPGM